MKKYCFLIVTSISILFSCQNNPKKEVEAKVEESVTPANKHMNKSNFDELVERFEDPERAEWQKPDEVVKKLGDIQGQTIIDIGCGTGYFAFRMAAAGASVICADIDDRFLEYVDKKKARMALGDNALSTKKVLENSPEMNHTIVDKAIIVNTYHHIENRTEYFKKVKRSLKDEGEVIIVDFMKNRDSEIGPPSHIRIDCATVIEEMKAVGLDKHELDTTLLPFQYIIRVSVDKDKEFVSPE